MSDHAYSIVVYLTDEGDVESMTYGDNTTLETIKLKVSDCPAFVLERITWLRMLGSREQLYRDDRLLGIKLYDHRCHVYLNEEERSELINFLKEKESAKRISANRKSSKRNPKPQVKRDSKEDGGGREEGLPLAVLHGSGKEVKA